MYPPLLTVDTSCIARNDPLSTNWQRPWTLWGGDRPTYAWHNVCSLLRRTFALVRIAMRRRCGLRFGAVLGLLVAVPFVLQRGAFAQEHRSATWLSSSAQARLQQLASCATLEAGPWKVHEGYLAHGEDPAWTIAAGRRRRERRQQRRRRCGIACSFASRPKHTVAP